MIRFFKIFHSIVNHEGSMLSFLVEKKRQAMCVDCNDNILLLFN